VGSQSGIIPFDVNTQADVTLSSIAFLLGTRPDACVLTVNTIDSDEFIRDSINTIKALSPGRTILLTLSDKEKVIKSSYGRVIMEAKQLTLTELNERLQNLESKFNLPATEVVTEAGRKKLMDTVINYFMKK
jgi:selenocysteine-specific translation elongation factor